MVSKIKIPLIFLMALLSIFVISCSNNNSSTNNTISWNEYDEMLKDVGSNLNDLKVLISDKINYEANKQEITTMLDDLQDKVNDIVEVEVPKDDVELKNKLDECMQKLAEGAKNANEGINSDKKELLEKADNLFKEGVNSLNSFLNENDQ